MQRDFGVYVVNMFDTGQATRVLKNARFSLAHLLKRTVDVDADKQCVNSKHAMHTTHTRALTFRPILPLSPFSLPLTIILDTSSPTGASGRCQSRCRTTRGKTRISCCTSTPYCAMSSTTPL